MSTPSSTYSNSTTRNDPSEVTRIPSVCCSPGTTNSGRGVYAGGGPEGLRGKGSGLEGSVFRGVEEVVGVWDGLESFAERACSDMIELGKLAIITK
jgi:hypothetical protein